MAIMLAMATLVCTSGCANRNVEATQSEEEEVYLFEDCYRDMEQAHRSICRTSYDENANHRPIIGGDDVVVSKGTARVTVRWGTKYEPGETEKFGLIWMQDYQQVPFRVDGKEYNIFRFSLSEWDDYSACCEMDLDDRAHEIEYLIVCDPDMKHYTEEIPSDKNSGSEKSADKSEEVFYNSFLAQDGSLMSFQLKGRPRLADEELDYVNTIPLEEDSNNYSALLEVVEEPKTQKEFEIIGDRDTAYIETKVGNAEEKKAIVLFAFSDWNQEPIFEGADRATFVKPSEKPFAVQVDLSKLKKGRDVQFFRSDIYIAREDMIYASVGPSPRLLGDTLR